VLCKPPLLIYVPAWLGNRGDAGTNCLAGSSADQLANSEAREWVRFSCRATCRTRAPFRLSDFSKCRRFTRARWSCDSQNT